MGGCTTASRTNGGTATRAADGRSPSPSLRKRRNEERAGYTADRRKGRAEGISVSVQACRWPITVGVDGSERALRAVRWGASEAARRGVPLRLVTAFGWLPERPITHPGFRTEYREILRDRAAAHLDTARTAAQRAAAAIEVEREVVVGSPYAVLTAEARAAQLLVVGSRGRSQLEGLLAGSVGVALAAGAACPVVVVRGEDRAPDKEARLPVVLGVDGAATSEAAIEFAFDAAANRGVELVAVHAWHDVTVPFGYDPLGELPTISDEELNALDERLAGHLAGWAQKHPGAGTTSSRARATGPQPAGAGAAGPARRRGFARAGGARRAGPRFGRQRPRAPRPLPGGRRPRVTWAGGPVLEGLPPRQPGLRALPRKRPG